MPKRSSRASERKGGGPLSVSGPVLADIPASAQVQELTPGLSTADALADLGVGRKAWRQLRAALQLDDDLFASLVLAAQANAARVHAALRGVLSADAVGVVVERLSSAAEVLAVQADLEAAPALAVSAQAEPAQRPAQLGGGRAADLALVRERLPRLPPNASSASEERRRAFRRRMQLLLPQEALTALRALGAEFSTQGLSYAGVYIDRAWDILRRHRPTGMELLADMISTQADLTMQRALRCALQHHCDGGAPEAVAKVKEEERGHKSSVDGCSLFVLDLPDAQLLLVLSFCASPHCLSASGVASRTLQRLTATDSLWAIAWAGGALRCGSDLRQRFLAHRASQCVECRRPTKFEHVIVGCRLCEQCERSCPHYALVRSGAAMTQFQLPERVLLTLPHMDGATGRVYLRSAVEGLAAHHHTREGLQRLRAKNVVGESASGRQRRRDVPQGRASCQSQAREIRGQRRVDDDPCCFEATALQLAAD